MSRLIRIAPKDGLNVRHANGTPLDAAGETVTHSTWWQRRFDDGDIDMTEVDTPKTAPTETASPVKKGAKA